VWYNRITIRSWSDACVCVRVVISFFGICVCIVFFLYHTLMNIILRFVRDEMQHGVYEYMHLWYYVVYKNDCNTMRCICIRQCRMMLMLLVQWIYDSFVTKCRCMCVNRDFFFFWICVCTVIYIHMSLPDDANIAWVVCGVVLCVMWCSVSCGTLRGTIQLRWFCNMTQYSVYECIHL